MPSERSASDYKKFNNFVAARAYAQNHGRLTHEVEYSPNTGSFAAVGFCESMFSPDAIDRIGLPETSDWFYTLANVWTWDCDKFLFDREEDAVAFRLWVSG